MSIKSVSITTFTGHTFESRRHWLASRIAAGSIGEHYSFRVDR
jgi:hypothetical protein